MTALDLLIRPVSDSPTYLDLRERIGKELPDVAAQHRAEMAADRRLPAPVVDALRGLGVFAAAKPVDQGGLGLTSIEQNDIVETLARIDASVAWCVMIGMDSGIYAGYLHDPDNAYFDDPNLASAGWIHPQGVGVEVDDWIEFTGTWQFGSGIDHADRVLAGIRLYSSRADMEAGNDRWCWRIIAAHPADFTVLDTWHTTGLEGSGSRHYTSASDYVTVPANRAMSFTTPHRKGPLYTGRDAILRKMSGVPVGVAYAAVELVFEKLQHRHYGLRSDRARIEQQIGEICALLHVTRSAVNESLRHQWEVASGEYDPESLHEAVVGAALARQNAFRTARSIVRSAYDITAGRAIYKDESTYSIDQMMRDIETINQHAVAQEAIPRAAGELILTGRTEHPFMSREEQPQ
ncbi:acyl-CoA dehydrogenase family protein [Pseudonocardia sp. ICBG601]|uniref:acyl-CoA dehydrogenase family protein n=1 Tax=Pseudonocardia sp. ICBG601 TaxID=2846759 RepID=UPI001CF6B816|nr:acyl-CoA dehydrogenase family protein [Pseudonocardia sp. ICBG601]